MNKNIAIVTGGTQGIGKAITDKLLSLGYNVVVADLVNESTKNNFGETENKRFFPCDISDAGQIKKLFEFTLSTFKAVDLLVNNAGIIKDNLIWNMPEDDFDRVIDVNLKGTWLMCKEAATYMKEQKKGRIVNIASRAWLGNSGQSNYSASKGGVVSLTRVLALELGRYNVCVNAIAPGLIDTPLTQKLRPDVLETLIKAQPTRSMGKPQDIANAVAFLGSYENTFITGQVLYVDGGKSVGANM